MSDLYAPTFIAPDPADLASLFPGYEIEGLVATGGMGAVYKAVQKSLDRTVAIKVLPYELSSDEAFRQGFEAEAKVMARLNHPNLIGVYDFGEIAGMLYIIMEYVPCGSLYQATNGTAIDPGEVVRLVSAISRGLAHAHENGIIHRDIKPANILLDQNANPKIGDFGLARPVDHGLQEGEEIFGTPHYTAPEVVYSPHEVDQRADIFSLGVILHELLTGHLPAEDPRPVSAIIHCDPRFDAIIRRATDPNPQHRYTSAHEIEKELHTISTTAGPKALKVSSSHAGAGAFQHKTIRKTQKKSAGSWLFLIFLAAAAGAGFMYKSRISEFLNQPAETSQPASATTTSEPETNHTLANSGSTSQETSSSSGETQSPTNPAAAETPDFDLNEFIKLARGLMNQRFININHEHAEALSLNSAEFINLLQQEASKITDDASRESAEEKIMDVKSDAESNQGRIKMDAYPGFDSLAGYQKIHQEFAERQQIIDQKHADKMKHLAETYILGIEKQIDRLKEETDSEIILRLRGEIHLVRSKPDYFAGIMSPQ